jgi:hypothetical protein
VPAVFPSFAALASESASSRCLLCTRAFSAHVLKTSRCLSLLTINLPSASLFFGFLKVEGKDELRSHHSKESNEWNFICCMKTIIRPSNLLPLRKYKALPSWRPFIWSVVLPKLPTCPLHCQSWRPAGGHFNTVPESQHQWPPRHFYRQNLQFSVFPLIKNW